MMIIVVRVIVSGADGMVIVGIKPYRYSDYVSSSSLRTF